LYPTLYSFYRGSHVFRETCSRIRQMSKRAILVGYNNDDPFSPLQSAWYWRHFLAGVPEYDLVLAYRPHNVAEFKALGARNVKLLRSWYVPERNHPVVLSEEERRRFECDVVFTGHYEDDGRLQCLRRSRPPRMEIESVRPRLRMAPRNQEVAAAKAVHALAYGMGEDYNKAICGARVALCFLSKLKPRTVYPPLLRNTRERDAHAGGILRRLGRPI